MEYLAEALPWLAFWAVVALFVWVSHIQYMAGHDTGLFEHKTPEEKRIREAVIRQLEIAIKKAPPR